MRLASGCWWALSENDAFCSADKGAALLDLALAVIDKCQELIERGVAATIIEQADFGLVFRAKDETGPSDAAAVTARQAEALKQLDALS